MKRFWKIIAAVITLFSVLSTIWHFSQRGHVGPPTPSKSTTFVTEPVHENGYIDYVEAHNSARRKGISVDENGAVPLVQAIGPIRTVPFELYWKGLTESKRDLPVGPFYQDLNLFSPEHDDAPDENGDWVEPVDYRSLLMGRPWTAEEFPFGKEWLDANERPFALILEAAQMDRFHLHLFQPPGANRDLVSVPLEYTQAVRTLARALTARAQYHLGNHDIENCQRDLIAVHRLGRHIQQNGVMVELLVGIAIGSMPQDVEFQMLKEKSLTTEQLASYQKRLGELPPAPKLVDLVNHSERLMTLSAIQTIHQCRDDFGLQQNFQKDSFDIDIAMQGVNEEFDQLVELFDSEDPIQVQDQLEAYELELESGPAPGGSTIFNRFLGRKNRARVISDLVTRLMMPVAAAIHRATLRSQVEHRVTRVALEIELFKRTQGEYPKQLGDLKTRQLIQQHPDWLQDPFSGNQLVYRKGKTGFLLYSVGVNRKDDGGNGRDDHDPNSMNVAKDDLRFKHDYQPAK